MKKIYKLIILLIFISGIIGEGIYVYAFSPYFELPSRVEEKNLLNFSPNDSLTINFAAPVEGSYYKDTIRITPQTPMKAVMDDSKTKIIITPVTAWDTNTDYHLSIPDGRAKNLMPIKANNFNFKTIGYPKVTGVSPKNGETDVRLDIEDPIIVKLDKSAEEFFIDFRFDPEVSAEYKNNKEKTQFEILPQGSLKDGILYTLKIFIKAKKATDKEYTQIYETSFTTLPPKPKTWAEDLTERVGQAKKFTFARIKEGKYIDVNLSTQIMTIFENGKVLNSYLISSGKRGMDTPKGDHQIYNKFPRAWSSKYGLFMPYWMAIVPDGKFGIHELPEWPGGYKEGQNHLGIPVSHGCMRLGVGPASFVYNWAEIGTKVVVY